MPCAACGNETEPVNGGSVLFGATDSALWIAIFLLTLGVLVALSRLPGE